MLFPKKQITLLLLLIGLAAYITYSRSSENPLQKLSVLVAAPDETKISVNWEEATSIEKNVTLPELFDAVPISSTNVFLIWPREKPSILYRYLCSAESWAFHHPNASVWYIFTVSVIKEPGETANKLLQIYPNIKFIYSNVTKLMKDTPLFNMTNDKAWESTRPVWQGAQMVDFLRQAVLWHKGGYYSDTDIYAVKSLWTSRNFISTSSQLLDPAVMHYDDHHPYTMAVMETIRKTFDPTRYMSAGPEATVKAMVEKCGEMFGKDIGSQQRTCTIDGRNTSFYHTDRSPYPGPTSFQPRSTGKYEDMLKNGALVINVVNSNTRGKPSQLDVESIMDSIGKNNCPFIYSQAKKHSNFW